MKSMTCQQLGGPCTVTHTGLSADDIIKAQDQHLKTAVDGGDETHSDARTAMKNRWRHPRKSMDWYSGIKRAFAELPAQ